MFPGPCSTPDPKLPDSAKRTDGAKQAYDNEFLASRKAGETRAAVWMGNLWDPGTQIRVAFLDGDPFYHQKVREHLKEWTDSVNLGFEFVPANDPTAMVRITFAFNRVYDSQLGRDANESMLGKGGYTMRLGFDPQHNEDMYNFYTLHEFGHVLGLVHEHQNPGTTIQWNERAVIDYYLSTNPQWTEATVRQNILTALVYQRDVQNYTAFDPDSIMMYPIPPGLASNIARPDFNWHLSTSDRRFTEMLYPFNEKNAELGAKIQGEITTDGKLDAYRFVADEGGNYTLEVAAPFPAAISLFGPEIRSVFIDATKDGATKLTSALKNPGTYFFKVSQLQSGQMGKYTVLVQKS
jgi:hypothetical protein